jgi:hypothetical protein
MRSYRKVLARLGGLVMLGWLVAACSSQSLQPAASATPTMPTQGGEPSALPPTATPPSDPGGQGTALPPVQPVYPEPVPTLGPGTTGEVPEALLNTIKKDLSARTGADPASIEVVRAEAVVWNDGSLGCPQPGMEYTQMLVDGYWVVLQQGMKTFDYRASESGFFFLCEGQRFPGPVVPGPGASVTPHQ